MFADIKSTLLPPKKNTKGSLCSSEGTSVWTRLRPRTRYGLIIPYTNVVRTSSKRFLIKVKTLCLSKLFFFNNLRSGKGILSFSYYITGRKLFIIFFFFQHNDNIITITCHNFIDLRLSIDGILLKPYRNNGNFKNIKSAYRWLMRDMYCHWNNYNYVV